MIDQYLPGNHGANLKEFQARKKKSNYRQEIRRRITNSLEIPQISVVLRSKVNKPTRIYRTKA